MTLPPAPPNPPATDPGSPTSEPIAQAQIQAQPQAEGQERAQVSPQAQRASTAPSVASTRDIVLVALFAALIAVLGLVPKVDLPFLAGVPITVQTLGVMLAGLFLGPRRGALAVLLLVFMVLLGAPFLSGGRGGLGVLFGPTAGFLLGWIPGAFLVGLVFVLFQRLAPSKVLINAFLACLVGGVVVIYAVGIPVLAWRAAMPMDQAVAVSLAFIPGDLLKAALAAVLVARFGRQARVFH